MEEIELAIPGCFLSVSDDNLLITSNRPLSSLSTAIYGGGLRTIRYALNHRLTHYYPSEKDFPGGSVSAYLEECARRLTADPEESAVLLTAATVSLYSHKIIQTGPVTVEIVTTGGVEKQPAAPPPLPSTGKKKAALCLWAPST